MRLWIQNDNKNNSCNRALLLCLSSFTESWRTVYFMQLHQWQHVMCWISTHLKGGALPPPGYFAEQLYLDRAWSRAAPSPAGSHASVCLHTARLSPAEEETPSRRPSGPCRTGSSYEAPHHTLHPAHTKFTNMLLMFPHFDNRHTVRGVSSQQDGPGFDTWVELRAFQCTANCFLPR